MAATRKWTSASSMSKRRASASLMVPSQPSTRTTSSAVTREHLPRRTHNRHTTQNPQPPYDAQRKPPKQARKPGATGSRSEPDYPLPGQQEEPPPAESSSRTTSWEPGAQDMSPGTWKTPQQGLQWASPSPERPPTSKRAHATSTSTPDVGERGMHSSTDKAE